MKNKKLKLKGQG